MTNTINNDNFLTIPSPKGRQGDTRSPAWEKEANAAPAPPPRDDGAPLDRARQRLAQEAERGSTITDHAQAWASLARLQAQLAADPTALLRAHGGVDATRFAAAMAKPAV